MRLPLRANLYVSLVLRMSIKRRNAKNGHTEDLGAREEVGKSLMTEYDSLFFYIIHIPFHVFMHLFFNTSPFPLSIVSVSPMAAHQYVLDKNKKKKCSNGY